MEALNKIKHSILSKTGYIEVSSDYDFDLKKKRFELIQRNSKETLKHIKILYSHFSAISSTLQYLTDDIKSIYGDKDPMIETTKALQKVVEDFENKHLKCYDSELNAKCITPLQKMNSEEYIKLINKRDAAKMKYDEKSSEVKRLAEKPVTDPLRLPKAKDQARAFKEEFESTNAELKYKLEELFEKEAQNFDSIMKGSIESTVKLLEALKFSLEPLPEKIEQISSKREFMPKQTFEEEGVKESTEIKITEEKKLEDSIYPNTPSHTGSQFENSEWYYLDKSTSQVGPLNFKQLKDLYSTKAITSTTYVYGGDLESWTSISSNPNLMASLSMD